MIDFNISKEKVATITNIIIKVAEAVQDIIDSFSDDKRDSENDKEKSNTK